MSYYRKYEPIEVDYKGIMEDLNRMEAKAFLVNWNKTGMFNTPHFINLIQELRYDIMKLLKEN